MNNFPNDDLEKDSTPYEDSCVSALPESEQLSEQLRESDHLLKEIQKATGAILIDYSEE